VEKILRYWLRSNWQQFSSILVFTS